MLTEGHSELFKRFRVKARGDKLREIVDDASYDGLTFEEKMEAMLDAELSARRDRKVAKLVKKAGFKDHSACVENFIYLPERTPARIARSHAMLTASGCKTAKSWS